MKAIIVEDEAIASRRLTRLLEERGLEIIKVLRKVSELKEQLLTPMQPDLYFFDVHLNDGIVFDAFEKVQPQVPIIFTTAYDQYAIKAFKHDSIDYLLKPIDAEELDAALEKYKRRNKGAVDLSNLQSLLSNFNASNEPKFRERISVRVGDKIKSININEVLFFYSDNKINFLFNKEGRAYPIDYSMEEMFNQLDPSQFFRVNRGHIQSITSITEVIAYSNSRLKVKVAEAPDQEIIVSREKVKEFKAWLG